MHTAHNDEHGYSESLNYKLHETGLGDFGAQST